MFGGNCCPKNTSHLKLVFAPIEAFKGSFKEGFRRLLMNSDWMEVEPCNRLWEGLLRGHRVRNSKMWGPLTIYRKGNDEGDLSPATLPQKVANKGQPAELLEGRTPTEGNTVVNRQGSPHFQEVSMNRG